MKLLAHQAPSRDNPSGCFKCFRALCEGIDKNDLYEEIRHCYLNQIWSDNRAIIRTKPQLTNLTFLGIITALITGLSG